MENMIKVGKLRLVVILDGSLFYVTVSFENYTSV